MEQARINAMNRNDDGGTTVIVQNNPAPQPAYEPQPAYQPQPSYPPAYGAPQQPQYGGQPNYYGGGGGGYAPATPVY